MKKAIPFEDLKFKALLICASATRCSWSARPFGNRRCVDRCWPRTRQTRRSETLIDYAHDQCSQACARGSEVSRCGRLQDQFV
ncbi:MAG TPA: hypothetical protein DEA94_11110 [Rhodobacteraceae bacterium]|nr:hypothetical protein [Paracoccaceae bacterium]